MGDSAIEDENSTATENVKSDASDDNSGTTRHKANNHWPNLMNNFNPSNWLPLSWATSNYWGLNAPANNNNNGVLEKDLTPGTSASTLAFQAASHQLLNGLFWDSFAMKALDGTNGISNFNGPNRPDNIDSKRVTNNIPIPSPFLDKGTLLPESLLFRPGVVNYPSTRSSRSRSEKRPIPDELKDSRYYERRKRNNLAAKKSRDARKAREDEVALRACFLEKENAVLRAQVGTLREEAHSLRQLLILQKKDQTSSA